MSEEELPGVGLEGRKAGGQAFEESDLLPISRLADIEFCERRAALHLIEMTWEDNAHTAEGSIMHDYVHGDDKPEKRGDLVILRGLWLRSLRLGLSGKADVVELHRTDNSDAMGVSIQGHCGLRRVYPVEYKPGRLKQQRSFQIQLCAQALCLEEMLGCSISEGALYYGKPHRRLTVAFDHELRMETEQLCVRLHEIFQTGRTPPARYEKKCKSCSLFDVCMPKVTDASKSVSKYLTRMIGD